MGIIEIFLIGISLSADAFAVSICKGLEMLKMNWKKTIIIGLYFGIFQALMPLIGYFLGQRFESLITQYAHWVAFTLLAFIGGKMLIDSLKKDSEDFDESVSVKTMLPLAIATSIDALAVGITFAFLNVNIVLAVCVIGIITFLASIMGVKIGNIFGDKYKKKAGIFGGTVLILIGLKILLEHFI